MIRKYTIPVERKVFREKDLNKLLSLLNAKYEEVRQKTDNYTLLTIDLECQDSSTFSFENGGNKMTTQFMSLLDNKKINSFSFYFSESNTDNNVIGAIKEKVPCTINIKSSNELWFNDTLNKFKEIVEEVEPQSDTYYKYRLVLLNLLAICYAFILVSIVELTVGRIVRPLKVQPTWIKDNKILFTIILNLFTYCLLYIAGLSFSSLVFSHLDKLWPTIEFNFGPTYLRKESILRNRVWVICSVIIIPVALAVILKLM